MLRSLLPEEYSLHPLHRNQLRPAVRINPLRHAACALADARQFTTKFFRRPCARLGDVKLPLMIQRVWQVHSNSGEFVMLFLPPALYTQPIARHDQPAVAINIEALMCVPT